MWKPNELDASYRLADYVFIVCILALGRWHFSRAIEPVVSCTTMSTMPIAPGLCWSADFTALPAARKPPAARSIGNPRFVVPRGSCTRAVFLGAMAGFRDAGVPGLL